MKNYFKTLDNLKNDVINILNINNNRVNRQAWHDTLKYINEYIRKNPYYTSKDVKLACNIAKIIIRNVNNKKYNFFRYENHKVKNTLLFDLPSIITCKYACKNCYALKSERIYKNTRIMRLYHYIIMVYIQHDKKAYNNITTYIINYLNNLSFNNKIIIRLHASGDFFNKEYLNTWLYIAKNCNNCMFYTYTKQLNNDEINNINNNYHNFNIVKSLITIENKTYINYGNNEYIEYLKSLLDKHGMKYYVCDYSNKHEHKTCMGNCHACIYNDIVLFYVH